MTYTLDKTNGNPPMDIQELCDLSRQFANYKVGFESLVDRQC